MLKTFFLGLIGVFTTSSLIGQTIDYSDTGNGMHLDKIQWLTWAGTDLDDGIHDGDSVNFSLPLGGNLEVVFSNVSIVYPLAVDPTPGDGKVPHGYLPSDVYTWCGATLYTAYDLSGSTSEILFSNIDTFGVVGNGENGQDINFDVTFKATLNGQVIPADIIIGDPETTNPAFPEIITVITNRGNWKLIENIRGTNYGLAGVNTNTISITDTELGFGCSGTTNTGTNSSPLLMTEGMPDSVTQLNYDIAYPNGDGHEGIIFGISLPFDQGDAPSSYLVASHLQEMVPVTSGGPDLTNDSKLYLGSVKGDPDYHTNNPLFSATANGDDTDDVDDEDGLSSLSFTRTCDGDSLVISNSDIALVNTTGSTAEIHAWVDLDQNGTFDSDEYAVANALNGAGNPQSDLGFSIPTGFTVGSRLLRLRLSTDTTLNNNTSWGVALDGEVEDFLITISDPSGCPEICNNGLDDDGDGLLDCLDCDDCSSSTCGDNDADNISDYCDLDDDNDGIPDVDEGYESLYMISGMWSSNPTPSLAEWEGSGYENLSIISSYSDPATFGSGITSSELAGSDDFPIDSNSDTGTSIALYGVNQNNLTAAVADDDYMEFVLTTTNAVPPYTFIDKFIYGIYYVPGMGTTNQIGGIYSYGLAISNDGFATSQMIKTGIIGATGNDEFTSSVAFTTADWYEYMGVTVPYLLSSSTTYTLRFYFYGDSDADGLINVDDISFGASQGRDTDGDGIADYQDLDSDNDGIFDVDEAGHTAVDANDDGIIDGANVLFGTNGLFDNLETSSDSDVLNYLIADSEISSDGNYDAYELDSDGDGCFDAEEESISDLDDDGIAGTGTPTVNSDGLVNSITYTAPANNNWQNPLIGLCLPEICNDGIDNDNDGDIDLDDEDCSCSSNTQTPLWVVDEDNGVGNLHLWYYTDYADPNTGVDFGRLQYFDPSTSTIRDAGDAGDMEAIAINTFTGIAYFFSTSETNNGPSGAQALFEYDLNTAAANQGNIVLSLIGHITRPSGFAMEALAFDNANNRFYSADPIDGAQTVSTSIDDLYYIDLSALNINPLLASAATLVGPISGIGETNNYVDGLEFDASGNLYAIDGTDNHLYQIDPTTGAITSLIDNNLSGGTGHGSVDIETIAWDAGAGQMIALDNGHQEAVLLDITQNGNNAVLMDYSLTSGIPANVDFEGSAFYNPCLPKMAIGNLIFLDIDNNSVYSSGEEIDGVVLELYQAGVDPSTASPIKTDTTSGGGFYKFENLIEGSYFIHIAANQFASGAALEFYISVSGSGGDNEVDNDDNGLDVVDPTVSGINSDIVTLTNDLEAINSGTESGLGNTDDDSDDNNGDMTVDFAFILNQEICNNGLDDDGDGDTDCADSDCITSPTINLSTNTACVNDTIQVSASNIGSGTTYNWNFGTNASPATASGIGPHDVFYTSCGNKTISLTVLKNSCSLSVDSIILIQDNTDPVWVLNPQDLIMECSLSANYNDSISLWLANDGGGVATDNCNNFVISNNYSGLSLDCGAAANATVQFTARDSCGNSIARTAIIQIRDTNGPIIQTVNDTLVNCEEIPLAPTPAISDSCDASPALTFQEVIIQHPSKDWKSSPSCSMLYEITNGWYDDKGTGSVADDEMSFTVTVIGQNVGSGWSTSLNGNALSGNYYNSTSTGIFLSNGSTVNFTLIDDVDNSCLQNIIVDGTSF